MSAKLGKLFPSTTSFVVFCLYIILFSIHGILVTRSQTSNNKYDYNIVTVVLLTEIFKLVASIGLYCRENKFSSLVKDVTDNINVLALYLIPAFLYCLYNNLSYQNLLSFDPTTYNLLLQFRIFITAVLFQIIFKKKLSGMQWISLLILTLGCMLKQVDLSSGTEKTQEGNPAAGAKLYGLDFFSLSTLFIFLQMLCSCLAGVYNEYLLKNEGANVNIFVQNVFMYLDSILCNVAVLFFQGDLLDAVSVENLSTVFSPGVLVIMVNNASVGIITSFFLKQLNSIVKTFASALELVLTAILCYLLLDIPIFLNTVLSMVTVCFAVYLYTKNPVKQDEKKSRELERAELLGEEV